MKLDRQPKSNAVSAFALMRVETRSFQKLSLSMGIPLMVCHFSFFWGALFFSPVSGANPTLLQQRTRRGSEFRAARTPYKRCIGNRDTFVMGVLPMATLSGALE